MISTPLLRGIVAKIYPIITTFWFALCPWKDVEILHPISPVTDTKFGVYHYQAIFNPKVNLLYQFSDHRYLRAHRFCIKYIDFLTGYIQKQRKTPGNLVEIPKTFTRPFKDSQKKFFFI